MLLCQEAGFAPKVAAVYPLVETVLLMVQAGLGIALLSWLAPAKGLNNLKFINIEGSPDISLKLVYKNKSNNPAVPLFVEKVRQFDW